MTWIQVYSGRVFDFEDVSLGAIDIGDIAHALARLCRFTGHTKGFYSVAQHSVLCAQQAPPEAKLHALLHDAHEAYVGDVSSPLKRMIGEEYDKLADYIQLVINNKYDVPEYPAIVKAIDRRMLLTEKRDLMRPGDTSWDVSGDPFPVRIMPMDHQSAEVWFLRTFRALTAEG